MIRILNGDCLTELPKLAAAGERFHAAVTDPPYELNFMGKKWDNTGVAFRPETWRAVYDCLLPGAYLLAFGSTRGSHRMTCAIEDAGFEIRDSISYLYDGGLSGPLLWVFGSGFPKSHNAGKTINSGVEQRYGTLQCSCMDCGDGPSTRDGSGLAHSGDVRLYGRPGDQAAQNSGHPDIPLIDIIQTDAMCELRHGHQAAQAGSHPVEEALLQQDLHCGGPKKARHGHASLWSGMEEQAGRDQGAGQGLPCVRENGARERISPSCSPPQAVSIWRDEPTGEPCSALRELSPQDRGDNRSSHILDPDRSHLRRIVLDDQCGWASAVARVCSWCGLPDREWLNGISGVGSALKPAYEPIIVARKPLEGTIAGNVLKHGCGGLNIDASRITGCDNPMKWDTPRGGIWKTDSDATGSLSENTSGRWPSNVIIDDSQEVADAFAAFGEKRSAGDYPSDSKGTGRGVTYMPTKVQGQLYADTGTAARFFFCAKADATDRADSKHHTVKPTELMRYLVRLVTPPGGTVLDPFAGSGSTLLAADQLGFNAVGIEMDPTYAEDARRKVTRDAGMFAEVETNAVQGALL